MFFIFFLIFNLKDIVVDFYFKYNVDIFHIYNHIDKLNYKINDKRVEFSDNDFKNYPFLSYKNRIKSELNPFFYTIYKENEVNSVKIEQYERVKISENSIGIVKKELDKTSKYLDWMSLYKNNSIKQNKNKIGILFEKDSFGRTPLFIASTKKDINFVKYLLSIGIDVNSKDNNGLTALMYAVKIDDNIDIINLLINSGGDLNIIDNNGMSVIMHTMISGVNINTIKNLIDKVKNIHQKNKYGENVLNYATFWENREIISLFLNKNVNFEKIYFNSEHFESPLDLAMNICSYISLNELLKYENKISKELLNSLLKNYLINNCYKKSKNILKITLNIHYVKFRAFITFLDLIKIYKTKEYNDKKIINSKILELFIE